ncbi:MAG: tetratricopeptide repeat protein [Spirochaetia bacterium]|nr:tetratricopeptide repeat protein [Spirochaetia bacterium]
MGTLEDKLRKDAVNSISRGNFGEARDIFNRILHDDLYNTRIRADMMYVNFWLARNSRFAEIEDNRKRGIYLLKQWKTFLGFIKDSEKDEQVFFSIKMQIFQQALYYFNRFAGESRIMDASVLYYTGTCYKNMGNYDDAIKNLEAANAKKNNDAAILAELADCYDLENHSMEAKLFFREAFYLDPQKIELETLESKMLQNLVARVSQMGYPEKVMKEWIPVYGALDGIFNIRRELKGLEFAQLKQSIVTLEDSLTSDDKTKEMIIPRLINKYMWYIDFYQMLRNNSGVIENTLKKIRDLNPAVYELYTN